jgi:RHS repeat-associated protein
MISGPESVDKFGRTSQVYADFSSIGNSSGVGSFGTFAGVVNLSTVDLMQKDVLYDYNNRVTSSDTWTAESGTTAGQWVTTQMQYDWNDDLISGKDQYYEKTSVLSQASGLTNSTPNIINATYTDARGRKVGTITYGATASDDITTQFNYNPIGELIEVVDPIGLSTFYEYDLAGRVTREEHPDRGVTRTVYDPASNVIQLETPGTLTFGGSVTMEYDYNRLVHKYMPLSSGADLYDMAYTYGTKGDGRNGAGRITQVIQGQGFKTDLLRYDELGNIVDENTTIDVPLYGYKGFTTTKRYDSFGRILQATYPDGDQVTYGYTALGELHTIDSKVGGTTQSIVSGILYNGYGQISKLSYGNGTYTDYDYNVSGSGASALKKNTLFKTTTTAKEQGATSQSTVLERNYTYNTQGMVTQLDRDVAGTLMNSSAGTTVPLSEKYSYDAFGRFDTHQHAIGGSTEYTLDMTYNKAGGIVKKDALATGITNFQDLNYTLNYNYSASNPHQLVDVIDSKSGAQSYYQYNSSGSIQEIQDHAAKGPQSFFWNEEQWLSGVRNDLGVHHYVYDHKGERVMKSSVMHSSVQVNDKNIDDVQYLEPYTLYINPYYVVTELQGGDKVSKHYYMNTQRVATDISINYQAQESMAGPQQPNARDPKKPSEDTASVNYNAAFADLQATLNALGHQKIDVNGLGQQPTLEEYYPELVRETALNTTAAKNAPESTTRVLFWYHPDYLGNVDLVTERDGKTYEFFTYNPWGEEMHQYNANTFGFSSPYRFNSKEKDEETGLHYYGARYYQSKLSVWMSVDPLAHETLEPYVFTGNNALTFVDPDGRAIDVRYLLLADNKYGNDVTKNVIADLEEITGLTITVSDKGLLEYAKDENGLAIVDESVNSSEARNMLTSAIDNEKETLLVYDVKNGSQADHGGLRMGLDNNQINGFINGATGVNNKTMGFGMTFLHELDHTALGSGNDDSKGLGKTGDVVDRMNIIRSQMGESWGQRLSYSALKQNGRSYIPMSPMSLSEIKDGRAPFGGKYIHY